jgi:Bacterial Ig domain
MASGDRVPASILGVLTALGFLLPISLYFWLISADSIDMLRADQWYDISLIQHSFTGTLRFGMLWGLHGDNRIFSQNIITLILGHVTHYNVIVEEYISAVLLIAATTLVILTHHRRAPKTHWIAYCPVAIVLLSIAQFGDTLYGFQIGWYLIMVALSIALFFLDRPVLTRIAFCAAVAAGIFGSFSSLQGLFIWPVGLVLLFQRARTRSFVLSWIAAGLASAVLYFHNWNGQGSGGISYALRHPTEALKFFFFAVGDVVSIQIPDSPHGAQYGVFALGIAIVGIAVWLLIAFGFRVDKSSGRPVGVALIWFGLLFAVAISGGRTSLGLSDAGTSRYVTFDLLILVGSYLVILDRSTQMAAKTIRNIRWLPGITAAVAVMICVQGILGTGNGISDARGYRNYEVTGAIVTANIGRAPDGLVVSQLGAGYQSADFIRRMAHDARVHHLSLFSTADIAWYSRQSLPMNRTQPTTSLIKPTAGEAVRGKLYLLAAASDSFGITKVQFVVRGNHRNSTVVSNGLAISFVYLGAWDTRTVPDGIYSLRSIAYSPGGVMGFSRWTVVRVAN